MADGDIPSSTPQTTSVGRLAGLAITYSIGEVFIKGLNYLLLPLYLQFLSPEEYGIVTITEILKTVFGLLLSFGMTSTILRFIHVVDEKDQRHFFGTIWLFLIASSGIATFILIAFCEPIFVSFLPNIAFNPYIRKTFLTTFFTSAFTLLPATLFRARDQARPFVQFGAISTISLVAVTVMRVIVLRQEARGWVQAQLEGAIIISIISTIILLREVKLNFQWQHLRPALAFSLPLIPHLLSHWVLGVSDRFILERAVGLTQLGLYSLGYQFGQGYQVLITGINNALAPMFGRASKQINESRRLPRTTTYYVLTMVIIALLISLTGGDLILLLFPSSYQGATPIVVWVILGYLAFALYIIPMNHLTMTLGETKLVPFATIAAAMINLILNLVFIPQYGIITAAVTTTIGYGVLLLLLSFIASRSGPLPIEWCRIGKVIVSSLITYILGRLLMGFEPVVNVLLGLCVTSLFLILLSLLRFWYPEEKVLARSFVARILRR